MNLLGKATSTEFWCKTVRNEECYSQFLKERHSEWEKYNRPILEPSYAHFKLFFTTGDRLVYQKNYYARRMLLGNSAILALIYPEEEKYIDALQNVIFAICDEYTWCLPAHQPKLEENNETFIDLFAAETGFALSEIYTMLGDRLDGVIKERIKAEINYRIINSFINKTDHWWEVRCTNNWASVCGGSVGCTFMLMRPELFDSIKPRFDTIMENYLRGFFDDGYCLEGTGYWHYGFGYFLYYADMVKTFTEGAVNYFERPKVREIATFIQKMYLTENSSVSFADGGVTLKYNIGITHYLKKLYPDVVKVYSPKYAYYNDGCCRMATLIRSATWLDKNTFNNPDDDTTPAEYYAKDSEWLTKRNASFGFAAKAGNNNEHHNHNDVGSFIFAKSGKHLITDMGSGLYTRQYFRGETRYGIIECSSLGHSVPFFGDRIAQKVGADFCATDVNYEYGKFSFDMAKAYGNEAIRSVKRCFELDDSKVTLTDTFDSDLSVTERFVSLIEPKVSEGIIEIGDGKILYDRNIAEPAISIECGTTAAHQKIYMIDFKLADGTKKFEITLI